MGDDASSPDDRADAPEPARPRRRPAPTATRPGTRQRTSGEIHTRTRTVTPDAPRRRRPATERNRAATRTRRTGRRTAPAAPSRGVRTGGRLRALGGSNVGRGAVAVLSVAVLVLTGYAWNGLTDLDSNIARAAGLGLGGTDDGAVDILLVGTDSRTDAHGDPLSPQELRWLRSGEEVATNTDTMLLIRVPDDGSSATAISIPRDSYVQVPGIGKSKINAAYGTTREGVRRRAVEAGQSAEQAERAGTQAGRKALIDTVATLTGVHVDHYAEVGLLGFVLLTNAVGGVEVCLKNAVSEPFSGADFRAGRQRLGGPQALSFVRQRHGLPRGDLDRITRQQVFMASLTRQILSAGTLTDPGKLAELEQAVSRSVVIDDDWDVVAFAQQLKDLTGGHVRFATIPVVDDHGWSDDGEQSVVTVDPRAVRTFTANLLSPAATGRGEYTVDVVNAGTVDGQAAAVSRLLTGKGYQPGTTSTHPADIRDSVIYARSADDDGARQLARELGDLTVTADPDLAEHRLRVVITNTYTGAAAGTDGGAADPGAGSGGG
ncbi:MAG: LCP family protein, partial [Gordonia sp. (in: high G+C Gram-positive bacteria)]